MVNLHYKIVMIPEKEEEEVERGAVFLEKLGFMWDIFMLGGTLIQILYTCKIFTILYIFQKLNIVFKNWNCGNS